MEDIALTTVKIWPGVSTPKPLLGRALTVIRQFLGFLLSQILLGHDWR